MGKWTSQCSSLLIFLAAGNVKKVLAFTAIKLDGTMGTSATQLSDLWYPDLLVGGVMLETASFVLHGMKKPDTAAQILRVKAHAVDAIGIITHASRCM